MSTQTEITRLQNARNKLRTWEVGLGIATSTDKLDELATKAAAIKNQGAIDASVQEGESYTIPAGYHNGSGTVKGVAGGGNYSLQTKSVTPTKGQQSVVPDQGYYGLSAVTVNAIPENYQDVSAVTVEEGDVRANKTFIKADGSTAAGTLADNGAVTKILDASTDNQSYTVPAGIHNGKGTVSIVLETKSATPTKKAQDITPTAGKVLSKVSVAAIPDKYQDISGVTAAAGDVLTGKNIVGADGSVIEGAMADNGAVEKVLDVTTGNQSYTVPAGYHNGEGTVSIVVESKAATPSKAEQVISATKGKVLDKVTVAAIPAVYQDVTKVTAAAGDVLAGKKIVSADGTVVDGTMADNGAVTKVLDATADNQSAAIAGGYHNGEGSVSIVLEEKSVTPSKTAQSITPTKGKVLSKVTVAAIPADYQDVTGVTAAAADVVAGKKSHSTSISTLNGEYEELNKKAHTHDNKEVLDLLKSTDDHKTLYFNNIELANEVVINEDGATTITLAHNTDYMLTNVTSLTISFPTGVYLGTPLYRSSLSFQSGTTATSFTYPSNILWSGFDIVNGQFVPAAGKYYSIVFWQDAFGYNAVVRGVWS